MWPEWFASEASSLSTVTENILKARKSFLSSFNFGSHNYLKLLRRWASCWRVLEVRRAVYILWCVEWGNSRQKVLMKKRFSNADYLTQ